MASQNNFKLTPVDGYALNSSNGFNFSSDWIDLQAYKFFAITGTFTGSPTSSSVMTLWCSDDMESQTPSLTGGKMYPRSAGSERGTPTDAVKVPATTTGIATATVSAAGTFQVYQYWFAHRWVQLQYTGNSGVSSITLWLSAKE